MRTTSFRHFSPYVLPLVAMLAACQGNEDQGNDLSGRRLNLFCTMNNSAQNRWTSPSQATRGVRVTDEVFSHGVTSLGLYGKVGTQEVHASRKYSITDGFAEENPWFVKVIDLEFPGDDGWPSGDAGYFYGYAPYPGSGGDEAPCYTVAFSGATPTMTFTMQADEAGNKDVLAAKQVGVSREAVSSDGIQLQFSHVLSALKFKFADADAKAHVDGADYFIQLKAIRLIGVYNQGTSNIGDDLGASLWTNTGTTADCSVSYIPTRAQLTADDNKAADGKCFLNNDQHCLLVLPQTAPAGAKIAFKCDLTSDEAGADVYLQDITIEASLAELQWLPGRSYTYTLGATTTATLWVQPSVLAWQVDAGSSTDLNLDYGATSLAFDVFYYRYDAVSLDDWSDSRVMVSSGADGDGKPLRSPFMTCDVEKGSLAGIKLLSSNPHFQFVTVSGDPATYSTLSEVTIEEDGTTRYFVVPTASASAGETAEVKMVGCDSGGNVVAILPYNSDVMPGSADHTTIRYQYFSTTDYDAASANANVRVEMAQ